MALLLHSVEISGFRGYKDPKILDLTGPTCFLFGGTGVGKSSTLGAIEWCLFGDFASLVADKTKTRDELVNEMCKKASVKLELECPKGRYTIVRTKLRDKTASSLQISGPNERPVDEEAESFLYKLLNIGFNDFTRAVYLHQENVRGLITEDPTPRNEAMDRLFGLESLRDISDGLRTKAVRDVETKLGKERQGLIEIITNRLAEAQTSRNEAKEACAKFGLPINKLSLKVGVDIANSIVSNLARLSKKANVEWPTVAPVKNEADLQEVVSISRGQISRIRRRLPEAKEIESLTDKLTSLNQLLSDSSRINSGHAQASRKLFQFTKKYGDNAALLSKEGVLNEKIGKLEQEREKVNSKQRVIKDGLTYLRDFSPNQCPICGKPIDHPETIQEHLAREISRITSHKLEEIDADIKGFQSQRDTVKDQLEKLEDLSSGEESTRVELESHVSTIAGELQTEITSWRQARRLLQDEIDQIRTRLRKISAPLEAREAELQSVEDHVNQVETLITFLRKQQRCEKLASIQKRVELVKIDRTLTELGAFEHVVDLTGACVRELQTELASSLVKTAMPNIAKIYKSLVNHPYYQELQIEVEPQTWGDTVRNYYRIKGINPKDGAETLTSQRFSTGQMNCVAIAIYLSMAYREAFSHNLNFLIIDDPSQNLDPEHKETLARILAEASKKKQLIVSTQDTEFQEMLRKHFDPNTLIYQFGAWSIEGPNIKKMR
jgi:exonuclease SbcC